ncbi:MAG: alpha/beta hydrolase family protein [Pirellulales bacterium]
MISIVTNCNRQKPSRTGQHTLRLAVAVLSWQLLAAAARADDAAAIRQALELPALAPGQVLKDVRAFIEPRIIKPPRPASRAAWEQEAQRVRRDMLEQIVFRGAAAGWREAKCQVEWLDTMAGGPGYQIRKFRYEALPGMWIPGLLYLPDKLDGLVPVAINVNGHAPEGKAVDYKQLRSINLAKRGMLVLNLEWFGMGQLRTQGFAHGRLNQLDLCGAGGLAPFYLALSRAVDLAVSLEHADKNRILVSGLSGGGWQTILISALDERVALANPVAGYGSFFTNIAYDDMGDSEQAPTDMATVADYTHLTALRAPRPTLLTYNAGDDCCFKSGHTLEPLLAAARPVFALFGGEDRLRSHVNRVPGTHNFEQENREQLYAAVGDYFYPGDARFVRSEIPSKDELKTAAELTVPLPADNVDFHRLAESLAGELPRDGELPLNHADAVRWQQQKRAELKSLLRLPSYAVRGLQEEAITLSAATDAFIAKRRVFKINDSWMLPATLIVPKKRKHTGVVISIADAGRAALAEHVARSLESGLLVIAFDPLFLGEGQVKSQDPEYTYPLFVQAVGERPLAIQAAQLIAIARWQKAHFKDPLMAVTVKAVGPRASMVALVAAALEPEAITGTELSGGLSSLKQLIAEDKAVEELPELFPFGLLENFDVRHLVALTAPRPVMFLAADEQARRELEPLIAWYGLFDADFDPVR